MISEEEEIAALSRALESTNRKAVAAKKVASDPLTDPVLVELARRAMGESLGNPVDESSAFPLTVWRGGASHTGKPVWVKDGKFVEPGTEGAEKREGVPGVTFAGNISTFMKILDQRSKIVVEKKRGWVVEPTTTKSGKRTNEDTLTMNSLFLDCDANGEWDKTLASLKSLDFSYIAYQSSGYQPKSPKWRVVLPLSCPFPVTDDRGRASWKKLYHRCRVLVGALGELKEEGFDPRTDSSSIPWFLLERRSPSDELRKFHFHPGRSLDLTALAMALPVIEEAEEKVEHYVREESEDVDSEIMDDERFDEIVRELSLVVNHVPKGRRDLYLSMPGVMLDRGLHRDDVLGICTEVSASYPRKHADKHADNVHNCKTTIAKFLAKDPTYTRIGTLQAAFPDVAKVLDRLLPNALDQAISEAVTAGILMGEVVREAPRPPAGLVQPASWAKTGAVDVVVGDVKKEETTKVKEKIEKRSTVLLRKKLEKLVEEKLESKDAKKISAANLLKYVLSVGTLDGLQDEKVRESATKTIFGLIGFEIGVSEGGTKAVTFDESVEALHMVGKISAETYKIGAMEFSTSIGRRAKWDADAPNRRTKLNDQKSKEHVEALAKIEARRQALRSR